MQWYGVKRISDGVIVSYTSDDAVGFGSISAAYALQGPYATFQAAQQALQPIVLSAQQTAINALLAKAPATWTLADIATWLQSMRS